MCRACALRLVDGPFPDGFVAFDGDVWNVKTETNAVKIPVI
jgi:hypothetical protein